MRRAFFAPAKGPARMALAIDSTETSSTGHSVGGNTTTLSWSFTNTAGNLLLVGVTSSCATGSSTKNTSATGVTYNGVALTKVGAAGWDPSGSFTCSEVSMWYLVSPPTGANTIQVTAQYATTVSTNGGIEAGAISFSGADTTTPFGTAVTNKFDTGAGTTSILATLSSTTSGNLIVDVMGCGSGGEASSSGTIRWSKNVDTTTAGHNAASSTKPSPGGSTTMAYSLSQDYTGLIAAEINAGAAGGTAASATAPAVLVRARLGAPTDSAAVSTTAPRLLIRQRTGTPTASAGVSATAQAVLARVRAGTPTDSAAVAITAPAVLTRERTGPAPSAATVASVTAAPVQVRLRTGTPAPAAGASVTAARMLVRVRSGSSPIAAAVASVSAPALCIRLKTGTPTPSVPAAATAPSTVVRQRLGTPGRAAGGSATAPPTVARVRTGTCALSAGASITAARAAIRIRTGPTPSAQVTTGSPRDLLYVVSAPSAKWLAQAPSGKWSAGAPLQ